MHHRSAAMNASGHHLDHVLRGNAVGWPLTDEVNAFTISLVVYPVIASGLLLYRAGRFGPGSWALVSGGGAVFVSAVHFGPAAAEPPELILGHYQPPVLGWLAGVRLAGGLRRHAGRHVGVRERAVGPATWAEGASGEALEGLAEAKHLERVAGQNRSAPAPFTRQRPYPLVAFNRFFGPGWLQQSLPRPARGWEAQG